jgi:hypothetical protein
MEIYNRMIKILQDVEFIKKDKKNIQQGFMFRGIDDMYNSLHELFAKHEVFICSDVLELNREERQTAKGGNLIYTVLKIKFTFQTLDGSSVESIMIGEAMDSGDKSANKAMSTALKYALMQAFLIPTEDLKDSDNDTYQVAKKELKEPEKKSKPLTEKFLEMWGKSKRPYEIIEGHSVEVDGKVYKLSPEQIKQCEIHIQQIQDLFAIEEIKKQQS